MYGRVEIYFCTTWDRPLPLSYVELLLILHLSSLPPSQIHIQAHPGMLAIAPIIMTNTSDPANTWRIFQDEFRDILGPEPSIQMLLQINEFPFAHEAGVFLPDTNELFVTSNQFKGHAGEKTVQVSKISLDTDGGPVNLEKIKCDLIHMANGGVNYEDGILICAQGSATHPSGLFKMQTTYPYEAEPVITSYMGRPFNAVNDVVVHRDGSIWFTDPPYGHDQGYRPMPSLPNVVYRYDPATENIRAVADGLGRPNGICFSPDYSTIYITDTDQVRGQSVDYARAASM